MGLYVHFPKYLRSFSLWHPQARVGREGYLDEL